MDKNIARHLGEVKLPKVESLEAMLGAIERELEVSASATMAWRLAQQKRQIERGIRGGGAPASRAEARALIEFAQKARGTAARMKGGGGISPGFAEGIVPSRVAAARRAAREAGSLEAAIVGGGIHGTAFATAMEAEKAYAAALADPTLTPDEKKVLVARLGALAAAKSNEILADARVVILFKSGGPFIYTNSVASDYYRLAAAGSKGKEVWKMGWGPNRSPSYSRCTVDPEKVIITAAVSSSWLLQIWLVEP
jgi:hypothetical protein